MLLLNTYPYPERDWLWLTPVCTFNCCSRRFVYDCSIWTGAFNLLRDDCCDDSVNLLRTLPLCVPVITTLHCLVVCSTLPCSLVVRPNRCRCYCWALLLDIYCYPIVVGWCHDLMPFDTRPWWLLNIVIVIDILPGPFCCATGDCDARWWQPDPTLLLFVDHCYRRYCYSAIVELVLCRTILWPVIEQNYCVSPGDDDGIVNRDHYWLACIRYKFLLFIWCSDDDKR